MLYYLGISKSDFLWVLWCPPLPNTNSRQQGFKAPQALQDPYFHSLHNWNGLLKYVLSYKKLLLLLSSSSLLYSITGLKGAPGLVNHFPWEQVTTIVIKRNSNISDTAPNAPITTNTIVTFFGHYCYYYYYWVIIKFQVVLMWPWVCFCKCYCWWPHTIK